MSTTTGLPAARQAASPARNSAPEPRRPSTYTAIAAEAGSSAKYASSSPRPTSTWLPTPTQAEKPMPACRACSYMPTTTLPDWLSMATDPGGMCSRGVRLTRLAAMNIPKVLGPRSRMPASRARATMRCSAARCSPPSSPNPAAGTRTDLTPRAAHSSISSAVVDAGLASTARSMGWPMSESAATVVTRGTFRSATPGLTPYNVPLKPARPVYSRMRRPHLAGSLDAPTTAMTLGRNMYSRPARACTGPSPSRGSLMAVFSQSALFHNLR